MISQLAPLPIGNAVRVILAPPAGAERWIVSRKLTDDIEDQFQDDGSTVIYSGAEKSFVDTLDIENGTHYFYKPFYIVNGDIQAGSSLGITPAATYSDDSVDALDIIYDRVSKGLVIEVARGTLKHDAGVIPVLNAPPIFDETRFPLVTIHVQNEAPHTRALGEDMGFDQFSVDEGQWEEREGWLAKPSIQIIGWSLNPDVRTEMRKALRRIMVANLPVFDALGMLEIEFSQQDMEDLQSYNAPVYQTMGTFTCLAPIVVGGRVDPITNIDVTMVST